MRRGFTLIELLVVIAIIGLLSSIVLASLNIARAKARDSVHLSEAHELQNALELYASDNNGDYPGNADEWYDAGCVTDGGSLYSDIDTLPLGSYYPAFPPDLYRCLWYIRAPVPGGGGQGNDVAGTWAYVILVLTETTQVANSGLDCFPLYPDRYYCTGM
ncbi:MAG TPA: type II secretion system protein [Candidatus Paceibacterota bacterium]